MGGCPGMTGEYKYSAAGLLGLGIWVLQYCTSSTLHGFASLCLGVFCFFLFLGGWSLDWISMITTSCKRASEQASVMAAVLKVALGRLPAEPTLAPRASIPMLKQQQQQQQQRQQRDLNLEEEEEEAHSPEPRSLASPDGSTDASRRGDIDIDVVKGEEEGVVSSTSVSTPVFPLLGNLPLELLYQVAGH